MAPRERFTRAATSSATGRAGPFRTLGVGHEITQRKRAEEERSRSCASRRTSRGGGGEPMKDYFLAMLSHA